MLIDYMGMSDRMEAFMTFVPDRVFNDLRYTINCAKLAELGWVEEVAFEDGLRRTVDWYLSHPNQFGNIESALTAHPRAGLNDESSSTDVSGTRRGSVLGPVS